MKRLRALRKKLNRISQMEEALLAGKTLNKEQEDVLKSKPVVAAVVDELERILASSVPPPAPSTPDAADPSSVEDLLNLLYFGSLFDVKTTAEFEVASLAKETERHCCLMYDAVTDDASAADMLSEADLNVLARLGALMTSRSSTVPHRDAIRTCVAHANAWLRKSDLPVYPGAPITYAGLRTKLEKIQASRYYTAVPEVMDIGKELKEKEAVVTVEAETEGSTDNGVNKDEEEDSQDVHLDGSSNADEPPKEEEPEPVVDQSEEIPPPEEDQEKLDADAPEHDLRDTDPNEQPFIERKSYHKQQGGGGRRGGGYQNGRGGRGGRGGRYGGNQDGSRGGRYGGNGGYQEGGRGGGFNGGYRNGRGGGQYYDDYQNNNYYSNGRGGRGNRSGGRGGGAGGGAPYNNNHGGPERVEVGANA